MQPVVLLMDETIGHMRENVDLDEYNNIEIINRKLPDVPAGKIFAVSAG